MICKAQEGVVALFPSLKKEEVVPEAPPWAGNNGGTLSLGLSLLLLLPQPPDLLQALGTWGQIVPLRGKHLV